MKGEEWKGETEKDTSERKVLERTEREALFKRKAQGREMRVRDLLVLK